MEEGEPFIIILQYLNRCSIVYQFKPEQLCRQVMIIIKNDVYPSYVALSRFTPPRISTDKRKDGKTHYGKFDRGIF
jgi:hypothetical protein